MIKYIKSGQTAQVIADNQAQVRATVEKIIADIEQRGEQAVREYSEKFDKWNPVSLRLSEAKIQDCIDSLSPQAIEDIKFAQAQIRRFAQIQLLSLRDVEVETLPGVVLGHRNIPVKFGGLLHSGREVSSSGIGTYERTDGEGRGRKTCDCLCPAVRRQAVARNHCGYGAGGR